MKTSDGDSESDSDERRRVLERTYTRLTGLGMLPKCVRTPHLAHDFQPFWLVSRIRKNGTVALWG